MIWKISSEIAQTVIKRQGFPSPLSNDVHVTLGSTSEMDIFTLIDLIEKL